MTSYQLYILLTILSFQPLITSLNKPTINETIYNQLNCMRCFFFLRDRRSSELLVDFLNVIVTAIVVLAPVTDCQTSPTRDERHKVVRASGGALARRLSVQQQKPPCIMPDYSDCEILDCLNDRLLVSRPYVDVDMSQRVSV
jgi:hypothetical protein